MAVAGVQARPITLGLVAPPSEPESAGLVRGVQLAVEQANADRRASVGLEIRSENGQWGSVGNDAVTLVSERQVDAMIAPADGAATHLILQVSGRTRVPVASVCADSSVTGAGVPWAVQVVPRTDQQAEALFAVTRPPVGPPLRWFVVQPPGRAGRAIRHDLETAARRSSTPLDGFVEDLAPDAELRPLAEAVVRGKPGGVLLWLSPARAGVVAAALRSAGFRGLLAGPTALASPSFFAAAGGSADGQLITHFRSEAETSTRADSFACRYRERYHAEPDASAVAGFDAARVLIELLERTAVGAGDRAFPPASPIAGVNGSIHLDATGNRTDPLEVLRSEHGRFVPFSSR